jgi:hypothetical protein
MSIRINIDKAKAIKLDQLRIQRKPLLESLDIACMRAIENNDLVEQENVKAKKQALRDITRVELPSDISLLKDFKPDVLK